MLVVQHADASSARRHANGSGCGSQQAPLPAAAQYLAYALLTCMLCMGVDAAGGDQRTGFHSSGQPA